MRTPRNYWFFRTWDTGLGYTLDAVRVQWDQIDWEVPWLNKTTGLPVLARNEHTLRDQAINWLVPRLRDHDILLVSHAKFVRVGELLRDRESRRIRRKEPRGKNLKHSRKE